jgi:hypothetical protein
MMLRTSEFPNVADLTKITVVTRGAGQGNWMRSRRARQWSAPTMRYARNSKAADIATHAFGGGCSTSMKQKTHGMIFGRSKAKGFRRSRSRPILAAGCAIQSQLLVPMTKAAVVRQVAADPSSHHTPLTSSSCKV